MWWVLCVVSALSFRGLEAETQLHLDSLVHRNEPAEEAQSPKNETSDIKVIRHDTDNMKEMLQSMLVANSQQMFALNNLQQETRKLRVGYEKSSERILKCRRKLADMKATTIEALKDEQLADGVAYPSFIQVDTLKESLVQTGEQLKKLSQMLGNEI